MLANIVDAWLSLFVLVMALAIYFIPTMVALDRHVVNKWSVAVINVFLGWTLIGWVVALAMAVRTRTERPTPGTTPSQSRPTSSPPTR